MSVKASELKKGQVILHEGTRYTIKDIQHVAKGDLHPFYAWVKETQGFTPGWNFNKVLIGPDGQIVKSWGSNVQPMGAIKDQIDALLAAQG